MTKSGKKYIIYIGILVVITALAVYFILKQDPQAVLSALASCNVPWLVLAIVVYLIYFVIEGLILMILARLYKRKYPFYKGVLNTFIGTFFSNITPSSSGGQFAQAYTFSKQGIKVTNAASILFMHFILYQVVMVIFSLVIFIFKYNSLSEMTTQIKLFGIEFSLIAVSLLGFVISAGIIVGLFLLAYSRKLHEIAIRRGVRLFKLFKIKNPDEMVLKINTKVETFRLELKRLTQNWPVLLITSFLLLLRIIVVNSVPYFLAKSMGLEFSSTNELVNMVDTTSMTWLVSSITHMIPIPGGSGGAELVFQNMFGGSFFVNASEADISALVLLWRGVTYYLGLIVGLIVFVSYRESPKKESFLHGDNKTLLELEVINLDNERRKTLVLNEYVEEELASIEDIEKRFKELKNDLKSQLDINEEIVYQKNKKDGEK